MSAADVRWPATAVRAVAAVAVSIVPALAACGGDDAADVNEPLIDEIAPAMAAIDESFGAPQRYFEVNATPVFVTAFVATDDATTATAVLYRDGQLEEPEPQGPASGSTFTAADVDLDADAVLGGLDDELDDPTVVRFAVFALGDGQVGYSAEVRSEQGGGLAVLLDGDGRVLSVDPL